MLTAAALVTAAGHSAADGRQQLAVARLFAGATFHCFLGVHTIVTSAVQRPTNDPVNNNEGDGGGVPRDWTMSLWDFQWTLATIPLNPQCLSSYIFRLYVEPRFDMS